MFSLVEHEIFPSWKLPNSLIYTLARIFILNVIKEDWIFATTRHHAQPNNMLLIRNLYFDSDNEVIF